VHYQAAKQYYEREGHLRVPRKHIERIAVGDGTARTRRSGSWLGAWVGNQRSRAACLSPKRIEQLSAIGMRRT
jgi:hypothetical protein